MNKEEHLMICLAPFLDSSAGKQFVKNLGYSDALYLNSHIYEIAPKILANPESFSLPDSVCNDIKAISAAPEDTSISWDCDRAVFDKETLTLTMIVPSLHCVSVKSDGLSSEFIGGNVLELDLSPKGNKALLRSTHGEIEIKLKDSKKESNAVLVGKSGKTGLFVGDIANDQVCNTDGLTAKERLIHFLSYPVLPAYTHYLTDKPRDDVTCNYLVSFLKKIAVSQNLYTESDWITEGIQLEKRPDFVYGKDYTHLYKNEFPPVSHDRLNVRSGR